MLHMYQLRADIRLQARNTFFRIIKRGECAETVLAYGGPVQTIVAAFARDERTIARWLQRCGHHAEVLHHQHMHPLDLWQVHVEEMWMRLQPQVMWVAMAVAMGTHLWLGAVWCPKCDKKLAEQSSPVSIIGQSRWP